MIAACLACCSVVTLASAQSVFDQRGFTNRREFFSQLPYEHIDPLTGNLLLTFTDLVLPGNAAFDLRIQRTYNSKIYRNYQTLGDTLDEDSWAGVGWVLHMGRVFNSFGTDVGSPIIEMPDGSRHQAFNHASPPAGCSWCYVTRDYWIYDRSTSTLTLPNGVRYVFGHAGTAGASQALYATQIADTFGNTVSIAYYSSPSDAIQTITQDLGGGQTRTVTFSVGAYGALSSMTFIGRTWTYTQEAASSPGFSLLKEVDPPVGPSWKYVYNTTTVPKNELTEVTTPNGGIITYTYADQDFNLGSTIAIRTRVIAERRTSGRDVAAGTWTYQYAHGTGKNQTVVTSPCGSLTYTFRGVGSYTTAGDAWRVGLQESRVLKDGADTLETEESTWKASVAISSDDEIIGFNVDSSIYVPLVESRSVQRGPRTWTATHTYRTTNFNDYGRPHVTSETGDLSRTITREFTYGFAGYIVDKLDSETIASGTESFQRSFDYNVTNGFRTSQTLYGVTTTYQPTPRGNVASETNARGHTTNYTNYNWGKPQTIQTPEYTVTRVVNTDGTIASETRRTFTTSFTYDALSRLRVTNPPAGDDIVRTYDNTNGTTETVTRDTSWVEMALDGFGRPSATQNSVGVKTDTSYDACGRRTYESYPFTGTSDIGTAIEYDALGRVKKRTHPDAKTQTVTYSGIDVSITDENGFTTAQTWKALADPDEARLAAVTDARSHTTSYTYNVLGSLRTVSGAGTREWQYNTKNQLDWEDHPESGRTTYTYDAVGNVADRTDASNQRTTYTYDGNNRLTKTDYPGTVHDVTTTYDDSDNRRTVSNGFVSTTLVPDAANRLTSRTDVVGTRTFAVSYTYDGRDNVTTITYPSGRVITYEYDSANRITVVREGSAYYATTFSYHPSGAIASYTAGNGLVHAQTFDNRYRVKTMNPGGALSLIYDYDGVGNVTSIDDSRTGMDQGFSYDRIDRLTSVTGWNAATFTYDAIGNRTSKSGPGATSYTYNSITNRLTSASGAQAEAFGWDTTGNLRSDGSGTYTYTPEQMLETATVAGAVTTYRYDGDHLRTVKADAGTTHYYVHGPAGALLSEYEEVCGQLNPARDYLYAGTRLIAAVRFPAAVATVSLTSAAAARGRAPAA